MGRVSTASRERSTRHKPDGGATLVLDLYREVTALSRTIRTPTSDRRMNRLEDELYEATLRLAGAPSSRPADIDAKLAVLCGRLREDLHPAHRGELLIYLLAESIREDFRVLAASPVLQVLRQ